MALSSYVTITETAVNNSEGSITVQSDTNRIHFSSDVDFEIRIATGGAGLRVAGDVQTFTWENCGNARGQVIYLWSAGNGTIHTWQDRGPIGG